MHVKRSASKAERRRLLASDRASDSDDVSAPEELSDSDKPVISVGKKRKNEASEPMLTTKHHKQDSNGLNEAPELLIEENPVVDEAKLQLLAIESRRLDFEVAKWKQQQALRRDTLQLKSEEIHLKEATTKQQQQTQVMELRAQLLKALDEVGKTPVEAKQYLTLLEG